MLTFPVLGAATSKTFFETDDFFQPSQNRLLVYGDDILLVILHIFEFVQFLQRSQQTFYTVALTEFATESK